jgi:hypothetical protein
VATAAAAGPSDPDAFDLFAQRVPATILRCGTQPEEVRLGMGGRAIRLTIASGSVLRGPVHLSFQLSGTRWLMNQLHALRALDCLMRHGDIPPPPVYSRQNQRRMGMILQTMDGLARGFSQRDIASAVFGEKIVQSDWGKPSDFLKSRVRRLIARVADLDGDAYLRQLQG